MKVDAQDRVMHICLVIGSHYPPHPHGGVGSFAADLAEGMVKSGQKLPSLAIFPTGTTHRSIHLLRS